MNVVAIVGMAGSGKSEVSRAFQRAGFSLVRFGDITDEEVRKRGLELSEENERRVRERLRKEHGMAAYAMLNLPKIEDALKTSGVVLDGLYSWEEYLFLREYYDTKFQVVAVWSSPETRYTRLQKRSLRGLTREEAASRDRAEIEQLNKGGPIAMADFTIVNEGCISTLTETARKAIERFRWNQ